MANVLTITVSPESVNNLIQKGELNEKQRRLLYGFLANQYGYGGRKAVATMCNVGVRTVSHGCDEFKGSKEIDYAKDRIRRPGAGRPSITDKNPELIDELNKILENNSYGSPDKVLSWTTLGLRDLSKELRIRGYIAGRTKVSELLEQLNYSRQQNQKMLQVGKPHPNRDDQFRFIESNINSFLEAGDPVISVDCKKKELIGNFKNNGSEYRHKNDPREVLDHDFMIEKLGKVAPYGIYVLNNNTGFVNLTSCSDTSEFAVESIRSWWNYYGSENFKNSKRLLIVCDSGGSNGCRVRLWKEQIAIFAEESRLEITICHLPPGTSKWNKIEHRMFSYISRNWQGKPLISIEVVVNYINNTTTSKGLKINCQVDKRQYTKGIKVSDERMQEIDMTPLGEFPLWNYTIRGFK